METGWLCPRCDRINAPKVAQCDCNSAKAQGFQGMSAPQIHAQSSMQAPLGAKPPTGVLEQLRCRCPGGIHSHRTRQLGIMERAICPTATVATADELARDRIAAASLRRARDLEAPEDANGLVQD